MRSFQKSPRIMEAQVGTGIGTFEADVIVNDDLRQPNQIGRLVWLGIFSGRGTRDN